MWHSERALNPPEAPWDKEDSINIHWVGFHRGSYGSICCDSLDILIDLIWTLNWTIKVTERLVERLEKWMIKLRLISILWHLFTTIHWPLWMSEYSLNRKPERHSSVLYLVKLKREIKWYVTGQCVAQEHCPSNAFNNNGHISEIILDTKALKHITVKYYFAWHFIFSSHCVVFSLFFYVNMRCFKGWI